jgi:hypothetical protein
MNGHVDAALADFDAAIQLNPKLGAVYIDRGLAWAEKHQYDRNALNTGKLHRSSVDGAHEASVVTENI